MTTVSWPGGCVLANEMCMLYTNSSSDTLMDNAPDEKQSQHSIEIITTSRPYDKLNCLYSSAEKRDHAFQLCRTPGSPEVFIGERIIVRLATIRSMHQVWREFDGFEMQAHRDAWEAQGMRPTADERGNFGFEFRWVGSDVVTMVRYDSEAERDADALGLYAAMRGRSS